MKNSSLLLALLFAGASAQVSAQSVPAGSQPAKPATAAKPGQPAFAAFGAPSSNLPPHPGRAIRERFEKADTNHNGKVSLEEAKATMPKVYRDFATIDTGKTGEVTVEQVLAHFQEKRAAAAEQKPAPTSQGAQTAAPAASANPKPAAAPAGGKP